MIAKIEKGRGFRGALNYALEKEGATLIGGNMATATARSMSKEFSAFRELRPKLKKAVAHISLSVEKDAVLTAEQWSEIAAKYMKDMGFGDAPYALVRHSDADHDHVHLIASRIRSDGSVVSDSKDYERQEIVMREVEIEYGLQKVKNSHETEKRAMTHAEVRRYKETGLVSDRVTLQNFLDGILAQEIDNFADFASTCKIAGIKLLPQLQLNDTKLNGLVYAIGDIHFKASSLGKKYTPNGLKNNGVMYESTRDYEAGRELANSAKNEPAASSSRGLERPNTSESASSKRSSSSIENLKPSDTKISPSIEQNRGTGAGDKKPNHSNIYADGGLGGSDFGHGYDVHINALAVAASGLQHKSQALLAKERAWSKQHSVLQAPWYRVTLRPRKGGDPVIIPGNDYGRKKGPDEIFYTAEEVTAKLSFFSKKNAQNYDVYVTPIDENKFYFLVDDMTPESEKALLDAGYTPALVQESSDNNKQAILICARNPSDKDEQTHANKVIAGINKKYGDANLSAVIRPFRMAGFANKKVGKGSPFTRIVHAVNVFCVKTFGLLQHVKALAAKEIERKETILSERVKKTTTVIFNDVSNLDDGGLEFDRLRTAAIKNAQKRGLVVDESVADYQAAKSMLYAGYSGLDVEIAIMQNPATTRKNNAVDYAQRTVKNAEFEQSEKQHKAVKNERGGGFEI